MRAQDPLRNLIRARKTSFDPGETSYLPAGAFGNALDDDAEAAAARRATGRGAVVASTAVTAVTSAVTTTSAAVSTAVSSTAVSSAAAESQEKQVRIDVSKLDK